MRRPGTGLNMPGWVRLRPDGPWGELELLPSSVDTDAGTITFLVRLGLVRDDRLRREIAHLAYSSKEERDGISIRIRLRDGRVLEWTARIGATRYEDVYVQMSTSGRCTLLRARG
jgi:hypothetical protein